MPDQEETAAAGAADNQDADTGAQAQGDGDQGEETSAEEKPE